ncbi:ABC transporter substrate-binding protein [Microbacterium suaedae]|uniref:ABC transporter substrate-binding protein n=1 Tax=Microbacterium suaedae TaxID=2067813 RepID=UPI000DA13085|nr:extracellular solute-binding protein [Microbacterium suaedae]
MKRFLLPGTVAAAALVLAGCSATGSASESDDPSILTISGWAQKATPEFDLLAEGFEKSHDGVTVEVTYYDPSEYDTLLTADLAAGSAPDVIAQKAIVGLPALVEGGQLRDVSDIDLPDAVSGTAAYEVDGVPYATPYRQDSWVLFYNKDLFDEAGVEYPDGTWTWDDYVDVARDLKEGLDAAGTPAKAAYQHLWEGPVQDTATSQQGKDVLDGEYDYLAPYYERSLLLSEEGLQESFNTVTANQLTYQGEFGSQRTAMMPMGTWYTGALIQQQESGDADGFAWGIAPLPQSDESTTGAGAKPVTFGDPTGFGINTGISEEKQELAKEFLAYAASEDAAMDLANAGIMPAFTSDDVVGAFLSADTAPDDELSHRTVTDHDTRSVNVASPRTAPVRNILLDLHTAVMSGSADIDDAIAEAEERVANEVGEE